MIFDNTTINISVKVLKNMSHKGTNEQLRKNNIYMKNVESFLVMLNDSASVDKAMFMVNIRLEVYCSGNGLVLFFRRH